MCKGLHILPLDICFSSDSGPPRIDPAQAQTTATPGFWVEDLPAKGDSNGPAAGSVSLTARTPPKGKGHGFHRALCTLRNNKTRSVGARDAQLEGQAACACQLSPDCFGLAIRNTINAKKSNPVPISSKDEGSGVARSGSAVLLEFG